VGVIPKTLAVPGPLAPNCLVPPDTINVKIRKYWQEWPASLNVSQNKIINTALEDYVYGVVMGELGNAISDPNSNFYGQQWNDQVLQAQSVAARTWSTFNCTRHSNEPAEGYFNGVLDASPDEEYRPYYPNFGDANKQHYKDVSYAMRDIYVAYGGILPQVSNNAPSAAYWNSYKGKVLEAEFRNDVGSVSASWVSSSYPYLATVYSWHNVYNTSYPGWGQLPAEGWVMANDKSASWYQTLVHYYTGISMMNKEPSFLAEYWNNTDCSGTRVTANTTSNVNYDWGTGSPTTGINPDNFCVQWTNGGVNFPYTDWYTFFVLADDGFRLYFDGQLISDHWIVQSPTWYSISLPVNAGNHVIQLRYYDQTGGAVARMSWVRGRGMIGTYYDTTIPETGAITDPAFIRRPDAVIQFDWGNHSPLDTNDPTYYQRMDADTFSARWQGDIFIPAAAGCRYVTFTTRSDDGIYLELNGQSIIDNWGPHSPANDSSVQFFCPGRYSLMARYHENTVKAVVKIAWQ
jgi:hypothetical protein